MSEVSIGVSATKAGAGRACIKTDACRHKVLNQAPLVGRELTNATFTIVLDHKYLYVILFDGL